MLVDSGAFGHCCPVSFGKGLQKSRMRRIVGAGGATIPHFGRRNVTFQVWGTDGAYANFEVCGVKKPVLSVGALNW